MKRNKKRIDTSAQAEPLTDAPFAALGGLLPKDLPKGEAKPAPPKTPETSPAAKPAYSITKTRKGGYPITFEKRAKGKKVTCLGNVQGDAQALLKRLKQHCGAGGALRGDVIEIQGDHRQRIEILLDKEGL